MTDPQPVSVPAVPPVVPPAVPPAFPLTVSDIRQFAYCPRIVYFTYVQPLERPSTYKMDHGLTAEQRTDALEKRRTLRRYGIPEGERRFDVPLQAPSLALTGRADMLILAPPPLPPGEGEGAVAPCSPDSPAVPASPAVDSSLITHHSSLPSPAVYPVEFKETDEGLTRNHRLQVTAYAMMAEQQFACPCPHGFIVHLISDDLHRVTVGQPWRKQVLDALQRIREMIDHERFPDPPRERSKCAECEFRLFCADVA